MNEPIAKLIYNGRPMTLCDFYDILFPSQEEMPTRERMQIAQTYMDFFQQSYFGCGDAEHVVEPQQVLDIKHKTFGMLLEEHKDEAIRHGLKVDGVLSDEEKDELFDLFDSIHSEESPWADSRYRVILMDA